jgi:Secretion system C-terminal sorting domain
MTHFNRISRFFAVFLLASLFGATALYADSFTYSPDTLTFTPTSQDSVISYVRIAYNGDTTGPGTSIHAWISDGSSYFGCSTDTVYTRSYFYLRVAYKPQSSAVHGTLSISDDSVTRYVVLIGNAIATSPALAGEGPYFPTDIREGGDTCTSLRLVNTSSSPDTIHSVAWTHNSNGIYTWDSVSLPYILGAHDTVFWTFCFHAPDNTEENIDTLIVYYGSGDAHLSRIVETAAASDEDGELTAIGPYFPEHVPEGGDTCVTMRLVNTGRDVDTVESINWSHNSNGIFTMDSTSFPFTMTAGDTTYLTFCYHAPANTETYSDTLTIRYNDASSDDRYDTRIVSATATDTTTPDGEMLSYGPYFTETVDEGTDTCTTMRMINSGDDVDTILSAGWSHDPAGIFSWNSVSLPITIGSHDTTFWTFCFNAPNDTTLYIDTFTVQYHDAYSHTRSVTRIVEAKATDPYIVTCYTLYASTFAVTNVGDTSYVHLYIRNGLPDAATLTGVHISGSGDGAFRVDSASFPTTIASDTYDSILLMFIPNRTSGTDNDSYSATLTASFTTSDTAECHEATVSLSGSMPQACSDTATVNVDTTGTDDVDLAGDSVTYYAHRIDVINNSNATIIVTAVSWLDSSSHFLISQVVPELPDTLAPGAGMGVIVHFYGDSGQTFYDTLALTIQNGRTWYGGKPTPLSAPGMMYINVKGTSTAATASVTTSAVPNASNLLLYPNPSSGMVTMQLDGATNAAFEVMDILGNVIASHVGMGTWQWDATASGLSNGTYFIRASSGELVATKRLVIQK